MSMVTQKPGQTSDPNAKLKAKMIAELHDLVKKDPEQGQNAASLQQLITQGHLPNSKKPVLYAIGGKAGLGTVTEYGNKWKQNPKAKQHCFNWNCSMMAGVQPPPAAATSTQAQLAASACFGRASSMHHAHQIVVEFRCPLYAGGNDNLTKIAPTMNDTGSNVQSLRRSDWNALKTPDATLMKAQMLTATGMHDVYNVFLEIRIVKPEVKKNAQNQEVLTGRYVPLTPWYIEMLRLVEDNDRLLSGETMRNHLYFATAPGNDKLYVSQRKNAIVEGLPVVQLPTV